MRLPGVRDLHGSTGEWSFNVVAPNKLGDDIKHYLQSGFVRGSVVGKPTTVRQTLDHL